ncbi:hypothetical protein K470107D9_04880 [Sutterella wadsworthensis]
MKAAVRTAAPWIAPPFFDIPKSKFFCGFMLEASLCWTPMDFGTWFVGETIIAKVQANFYSTTFSS